MKKNILLLINGFGVEQVDSVDIYSKELMPNMDMLTNTGIFGTVSSNELDYKDGYRKFSIGIGESLTYSIVNNDISNEGYKKNQMLNYLYNDLNQTNAKLHVICYFDSETTIYHLTTFLKEAISKTKSKIFIHLILTQKRLSDYRVIEKCINSINYEFGNNVKIGFVSGENNTKNLLPMKDIVKMLVTESGERWKDTNKKIDVLYSGKTLPIDARTFSLNSDFALSDNDSIFFFNYDTLDVTPYTKELIEQKYKPINLSTIKFYSLFQVGCQNAKIPFIYNYGVSSTYALNSLKSINAKCLIMDKKDNFGYINYYMTGLRNTNDVDLKYMPTDNDFIYDPDTLVNTIASSPQELIIVNYEINTCKIIDDIKNRLSKIDQVIGKVYEYASNNNCGLFISSLYGFEKEMYNSRHEVKKVNFSTRVPVVIADKSISKTEYSFVESSVYDLSNTIFWNINHNFKNTGLLKKKSSLMSIFYKKPKQGGK